MGESESGRWTFLNDRLVREEDARISVLDRGFLYGDGIFETLRVYDGRPFKAPDHVARLYESAASVSLQIPVPPARIHEIFLETIEANELKEAALRIIVSRGTGEAGLLLPVPADPTLVVTLRAFKGLPASYYTEGVKALLVKTRKVPPSSIDPKIKSLNCLVHVLARQEAFDSGAFEGILLNPSGHLCEGTVSNLFMVKTGVLWTPASSCGILEGITRKTVMELAIASGIEIGEGQLGPDSFFDASECFLTSSLMELMPVREVLGLSGVVGKTWTAIAVPGPITTRLWKAYRETVRGGKSAINP
jgi:branched-chain amino acid aminotransferase